MAVILILKRHLLWRKVVGAYIYCGVMFSGWDLVNRLPWRRNDVSLFYFDSLLFPAGVLATATAFSLPFDVLRRKMMAYDPSLPKNGNCDVVASTLRDAVVNTYKDAGFPGFLRGFCASVIKSAPQAVVFYFAFKVTQQGVVATIGREKTKK
uniref:ADP/ATP translocase n=1 Tax=Romanomermis culicivorax TaxID=13658 RepID=A0A915I007_ROMCU